jgi:hypothetical protein
MIHFHKYVNDSQGAIYCLKCRKFKGWMKGKVKSWVDERGDVHGDGWGYLLNGRKWTEQREWEIRHNGGKYE